MIIIIFLVHESLWKRFYVALRLRLQFFILRSTTIRGFLLFEHKEERTTICACDYREVEQERWPQRVNETNMKPYLKMLVALSS